MLGDAPSFYDDHLKVSKSDAVSCANCLKHDSSTHHLEEDRGSRCDACLPGLLRRCTGCQSVVYCGQDCQRAHWKAHRKRCREVVQTRARYKSIARGDSDRLTQFREWCVRRLKQAVLARAADARIPDPLPYKPMLIVTVDIDAADPAHNNPTTRTVEVVSPATVHQLMRQWEAMLRVVVRQMEDCSAGRTFLSTVTSGIRGLLDREEEQLSRLAAMPGRVVVAAVDNCSTSLPFLYILDVDEKSLAEVIRAKRND